MKTIECCRVCGGSLRNVLSLGELHLSAFVDPGVTTPKYPLTLALCSHCKLVQLRHTTPAEELYEQYWYRSGTNASMTRELEGIARVAERELTFDDVALDIGCNDGTLLRAYKAGVFTVGFEPAKNLVSFAQEDVNLVVNEFFSAGAWFARMGPTKAKVITSIAMFYDLDDPNAFVADVGEVLKDDGLWIIQMADLKSMLDRTMWDNICHEHLEYYSLIALDFLLHHHGLYVEHLEHNDVNGGSTRYYVRKDGHGLSESSAVTEARRLERAAGLDKPGTYEAFAARVRAETWLLTEFVAEQVAAGKKVYVYGASTKGNTLLQYAGLDHALITAAAERNPYKWGKVTVGTNIPIISEQEARAAKPGYFLVLPWHFLDEFVERESEYLAGGGAFVVPLPAFRVVRGLAAFGAAPRR